MQDADGKLKTANMVQAQAFGSFPLRSPSHVHFSIPGSVRTAVDLNQLDYLFLFRYPPFLHHSSNGPFLLYKTTTTTPKMYNVT